MTAHATPEAMADMAAHRATEERLISAGFAKTDLVAVTTEFVSDMKQLLSPERVAAIWAGEPDPWEERS